MKPSLRQRAKAVAAAMFGDVQSVSDENGWLIRAIGAKTKAGVSVSEYNSITMPAVWACITLISDAIAQLPVDVLRRRGTSREEMRDHPIAFLLNGSANDDMGASVFRGASQMHALLWGNGYAEIERNGRGVPVGLWPLLPDVTRPDVRFAAPRGRSLTYRTSINGMPARLDGAKVLHIKGQSYDGICGLSPISASRQAIGLGLAMEEFGSKYFANDAKSGGFIMHPGKLSATAVKNIQDSFGGEETGRGGLDNAHKIKVLEEAMKYVATTIPPEDSQFLESRAFQVSEVARIYRVPLPLLQTVEGSTVWGTGIEQLMIAFVVYTLTPWLRRWEEELSRKLLTNTERAAGVYIKFNVNALLRGDMAARAEFYSTLYNIASINPNEIRANEDMNPYDGGGQFRAPLNTEDPQNPAPEPTTQGEIDDAA